MRISKLRSYRNENGAYVAQADVDGELLWFASTDAQLTASPEAFASALFVPAAARNEVIFLDEPVDRTWLKNTPKIVEQLRAWWDLPGAKIAAAGTIDRQRHAPGKIAQCFTAGVDSFYELITAKPPPQALVFVHGYDFPLSDRVRLDAALPGIRETASAFRAEPILISTNLRDLRAMRKCSWKKSHGGALAALGHLLNENISLLRIPSGFTYQDPHAWGSHWDFDPLWSSSIMKIEHCDATLERTGKVRVIANNALVRKHLRVCHENREPTGNCSRCEKCIRTMIAFANAGQLEECKTFDSTLPLRRRIDLLPLIERRLIPTFEDLRKEITDPELATTLDSLLRRSRSIWAGPRKRLIKWRRRYGLSERRI
jgi:hypothetical protein